MSHLIPISEIPTDRYEFFANEMGISKTTFKKKAKNNTYIQFYWYKEENQFKVTFHSKDIKYGGKVVSQLEYEDLKYNLMVVEETPEQEKYRKLQNTSDWIKNSTIEEFVSTMPEPIEQMVKNPHNHPTLANVWVTMNHLFNN